jgi:hypothetical protein
MIKAPTPATMSELLSSGELGALTREAERRRGITARVRAQLPPEEADHLVSATTTAEGELILVMDSALWAARVRYRAQELGAQQLRVRVVPR